MNMRVGDYVRTKNGSIGKIVDIKVYYVLGQNEKEHYVAVLFENDFIPSLVLKVFIKKSGSLIDVLEVGDYVNEHKIDDIETIANEKYVIITINETEYIKENQIESIVTHEQFESMQYKVSKE